MGDVSQIRAWSEAEFASSRAAWQALLEKSDADPLFMSWDWQWRWWQGHASALSAQLYLVATYGPDGALIGLAPFYLHVVKSRALLSSRRLELIGIAWRNDGPAFSEYLDLVAARGSEDAVIESVANWLRLQDFWQDLTFAGIRENSHAARLARDHLRPMAYVRDADPMVAYRATLPAAFSTYVESLGSSTRRRLFSQRRKLSEVTLSYANADEVGEYLELLWRFKAGRWSARHEPEGVRRFHIEFATEMARTSRLYLTRLSSRNKTLSVMYNVRMGDTEYYLQSGFDVEGASGISFGYLHFGYAIEKACEDGVAHFDFLGGQGLNRDYKRDLATEPTQLVCYHAIRAPLLRALHTAYDSVRH